MGRPGASHRRAARRVLRSSAGSDLLEGGVGWWFEREAEVALVGKRYAPDIAGWQVGEEPSFVGENRILVVPDWACEILSRSTQARDRAVKLPTCVAADMKHVWIVDPGNDRVKVSVEVCEGE